MGLKARKCFGDKRSSVNIVMILNQRRSNVYVKPKATAQRNALKEISNSIGSNALHLLDEDCFIPLLYNLNYHILEKYKLMHI